MPDPHAAAPEVKRIQWLVRVALLWALVIFGRLAWLQTYSSGKFQQKATLQQVEEFELQPPRGPIRTRDGAYLAVSVPAWTVVVNPRKLTAQAEPAALAILVRMLHLDPARLRADLSRARAANRGYLKVKSKAEPSEYQALKSWLDAENKRTPSLADNIDWLSFQQESWRAYPNNELAAALVGSVDFRERGNAGIELTLQNDLRGEPGRVRMLKDSRDNNVSALDYEEPRQGKEVTLTIDSHLQFYCDRELAAAVRDRGFTTGTIVAMNPQSGEVLAMSAYPSFNPNQPVRTEADTALRIHRAVGAAPDPGSVMKMITLAAALEHTDLRASSPIDCGNGQFWYSKKDKIGDTHAYGVMPFEKVLWLSSNIGAIRIGIQVKAENLFRTLIAFGFGRPTGIALPGESAGILNPLSDWKPSSIYFVSMGHELGVTTIQLAQAAAAFANGGWRVRPKLVLSKQAPGGAVVYEPESPRVRAISGDTAVDMRNMSEGVVLRGTGGKARIAGRTVGGKTGTAQMIDKRTGKYVEVYSSSFMGYAPLHAPKVVVVVTLNGGKSYGGESAAPVFARVAAEALNMLGEPADVNITEAAPAAPSPTPVAAVKAPAEPTPAKPNEVATGAPVPDFNGMDKRTVARVSAERGLPVEMSGAGLARSQNPAPGSILAMGASVQVRFAR